MVFVFFFFFFSSRRRHTRVSRDWSSDVCSSDLVRRTLPEPMEPLRATDAQGVTVRAPRSEERRVGKGVDLGGCRIIKKKKTRFLSSSTKSLFATTLNTSSTSTTQKL